MERVNRAESPFLFFVILIPLLTLNYLAVIHPILVEWILLSSPLWVSKFDIWLVNYVFGTFTYELYLLLWAFSYFLSFIMGSLIALLLSKPFRNLLKNDEVVVGQMELVARTVLDFNIGAFIIIFMFNYMLSLITAQSYELISQSVTSSAVLTGFLTGNVISKCVFLLLIYIKCKRNALVLESTYLPEEKVKRKLFRKIRWSLKERPSPTVMLNNFQIHNLESTYIVWVE